MGLEIIYDEGQTPLDDDEKEDLVIKSVTTRRELDELEQLNIEAATEWTLRRKFKKDTILSERFLNELHERMYSDVWKWAGTFRRSAKNIGVDKQQIPIALRQLLDDCKYWIDHKTHSEDEISVRFKHRLVSIHCYSNGNGRHSRLIADVIASHLFSKKVFTWGAKISEKDEGARSLYLKALKAADKGDYSLLLAFARS
jgi:Fic-DOC domain mobile mystery protein B